MSVIRVLHGTPDDGELAALVAVLATVSPAGTRAPVRSTWGDPAWRAREPRPGAGAWRMSGLPR